MRLTLICVKSFKHPWSFNQQHCSLRYNLNQMNPNPIYIISTCIYRRTRTTYLICYKVCVNGCCMYTCNITFFPFFSFFRFERIHYNSLYDYTNKNECVCAKRSWQIYQEYSLFKQLNIFMKNFIIRAMIKFLKWHVHGL